MADYDWESVWERVKDYIDTTELTSKTTQELANNIKYAMEKADRPSRERRGNMDSLINSGFPKLVSEIPSIANDYLELPSPITERKGNKFAIKTKSRGTRVLSKKTTKIISTTYKGERAFFIYNTKLKRTITWVKE